MNRRKLNGKILGWFNRLGGYGVRIALNIADHGYSVAVYNRSRERQTVCWKKHEIRI